jgi:hypothetical protein
MWIKKNEEVEVQAELEFDNTSISNTNAYEVTVTECRLAKSTAQGSKSLSVVVGVETEDGETNKTFFTILGKDGETYFTSTYKGKVVKKQHFGLSIINTLFQLTLNKEIFDVEPEPVTYTQWDKEEKEMAEYEGEGFPSIVGKKVGICLQMVKEIAGTDSKEYGKIEHFFDLETGLFAGEDKDTKKTKLNKWLGSLKEYKVIEKEAQNKSAFGNKKETETEDKPKSRWGR